MQGEDADVQMLVDHFGACSVAHADPLGGQALQADRAPFAHRALNEPQRRPKDQHAAAQVAKAAPAAAAARGAESRSTKKKMWTLSDFDIGPKRGEGRYGKVFVVRLKQPQLGMKFVYAMKELQLENIHEHLLRRELQVHRMLRHPHIVRFVTYFNEDKRAYVIMEYCAHGTIWEKMQRHRERAKRFEGVRRGFDEQTAAKWSAQLAEAIAYMHQQTPPVLHRDIKPENTFLDVNDNLKLGDFGWSTMLRSARNGDGCPPGRRTVCGTPDYFAPEMCRKEEYDTALDAWCIGIFTFEMLYHKAPFEHRDNRETMRRIKDEPLIFPAQPAVSESAKDLVRRLLVKDHTRRMKVHEIFRHPWVLDQYYRATGATPPSFG